MPIEDMQQICNETENKGSEKLKQAKCKGTLSAVLIEEGLPCIKKLLSTELKESPSSFLMSSSSLSRLTPFTTLTDFVSEPAEGTTASAALDLDSTPTSGPCGDLQAAL